ncbi:hypothetical protein PCANC_16285 [Puccinia coronata f. sp. avenae]|uniref:Uncharacterized protein n=1 Tax=Puccinia coronata f. sp. avenae TaxID=200324 RepID=A0A2N5U7Q2_9BASI|nr:hypothetical protein PCANC_16285 [Puccinia coronata f. sp. avenae]
MGKTSSEGKQKASHQNVRSSHAKIETLGASPSFGGRRFAARGAPPGPPIRGTCEKKTVKPRLHAVLPGGDVIAPGERLVSACRGITPRQAGPSLYQPAKELILGVQVQAGTCSPREHSSASWYKLVQARRGITPRQAGTSLYQPAGELFLGEQVQAGTCSPRDNPSASWSKLVPAHQKVIPWQAGTLPEALTCTARNDSLPSWYKVVPARRGAIPWQAGASRYLLAEE